MTPKTWIIVGSLLAGLSVALGAFGAHLLPGALRQQGLDEAELLRRLANWETAARYQMYHALAILFVGWLLSRESGTLAQGAGWSFLLGTVIFSGCLYALVLSGVKVLGAVVPIGGLLLIAGWLLLAAAAWTWPGK